MRLMTAGAGFAVALIGLILFFILGPRTEENRQEKTVVRSQIEGIPAELLGPSRSSPSFEVFFSRQFSQPNT